MKNRDKNNQQANHSQAAGEGGTDSQTPAAGKGNPNTHYKAAGKGNPDPHNKAAGIGSPNSHYRTAGNGNPESHHSAAGNVRPDPERIALLEGYVPHLATKAELEKMSKELTEAIRLSGDKQSEEIKNSHAELSNQIKDSHAELSNQIKGLGEQLAKQNEDIARLSGEVGIIKTICAGAAIIVIAAGVIAAGNYLVSVLATNDNPTVEQAQALVSADRINTYESDDADDDTPNLTDYATIGVSGVTAAILDALNEKVAALGPTAREATDIQPLVQPLTAEIGVLATTNNQDGTDSDNNATPAPPLSTKL